jgi:hypothetical protein
MKNHVTDMAPIKETTPYMPRTTFRAIIDNNSKGINIRKNGK